MHGIRSGREFSHHFISISEIKKKKKTIYCMSNVILFPTQIESKRKFNAKLSSSHNDIPTENIWISVGYCLSNQSLLSFFIDRDNAVIHIKLKLFDTESGQHLPVIVAPFRNNIWVSAKCTKSKNNQGTAL